MLVVGRSGGNSQYWIVRELQRHPIYRSFGSRTLLVADLRRDYNGESERLMRELDIKYEDFPTAVLFAPNAIPVIVKNVENARDIEQRASVEIARDINE